MNLEESLERILPNSESPGDAVNRPWLIAMNDWPSKRDEEKLLSLVENVFAKSEPGSPLPLVFVVENVGSQDEAYRGRLDALAEAGALILEPESEDDANTLLRDLTRFVAVQMAAATPAAPAVAPSPVDGFQQWLASPAVPVPPTGPHPSSPSYPQGYREFATAFTKLSPEQIEEMMNIRK